MIPIKIKTTGNIVLSEELSEYAEKKFGKLERFAEHDEDTALFEVELESLSERRPEAYRVEVNFSSRGKVMRVEAKDETLHGAIDKSVDEAARRLKRLKGKHQDLFRRSAFEIKDLFRNLRG